VGVEDDDDVQDPPNAISTRDLEVAGLHVTTLLPAPFRITSFSYRCFLNQMTTPRFLSSNTIEDNLAIAQLLKALFAYCLIASI